MTVTYAIHLLAAADAREAQPFPDVTGPFVPRKGDTVLLPVTATETAVCLVTDVFLSVVRDGSGVLHHQTTVVEVVRDPSLNVAPMASAGRPEGT